MEDQGFHFDMNYQGPEASLGVSLHTNTLQILQFLGVHHGPAKISQGSIGFPGARGPKLWATESPVIA